MKLRFSNEPETRRLRKRQSYTWYGDWTDYHGLAKGKAFDEMTKAWPTLYRWVYKD